MALGYVFVSSFLSHLTSDHMCEGSFQLQKNCEISLLYILVITDKPMCGPIDNHNLYKLLVLTKD